MELPQEVRKHRNADYDVHPIIISRWSPRAMNGKPISESQLFSLFEAARWAPSSRNEQPWRFLYAMRDTEHWQTFFDLLVEGNQVWCKDAAALIVILSKERYEHKDLPNPSHAFSTGSAFENLALQATAMGLVSHPIGGFDHDRAREELNVPEGYAVVAMCAVGNPGERSSLPEELQEREQPPGSKPVGELIME